MLWSMDSRQCGRAGRMRISGKGAGWPMLAGEGLVTATATAALMGNDEGGEFFLEVGAWGW